MTRLTTLLLATLAAPGASQERPEAQRLVVHEWGTFTSLHGEDGRAIGGINSDDEPVPRFVHRLVELDANGQLAPVFFQGAPRCHPDVTMRLETPVLYFHPPAMRTRPTLLDVSIGFRGGWTTEFYPAAKVTAPGVAAASGTFGGISADAWGRLVWRGLSVGGDAKLPETDWHVWLAPRRVRAADVVASNGEGERYLFYRGVGRVDAPLAVARAGDALSIRDAVSPDLRAISPMRVTKLWLVDVRADRAVAWRPLDPVVVGGSAGRELAQTRARFAAAGYAEANLDALSKDMHAALVADGLFADEATAMLATWRLSYFESAGLRLFFLVPRTWTDHVLPLELSARAAIERTMVGRIEIVTPEQRALLREIAAGPTSEPKWFHDATRALLEQGGGEPFRELWSRLSSGRGTLREAGIEPPADYGAYLDLGRFRNALVLDEQRRRPSDGLKKFIEAYSLEGHVIERCP